ncbi:MAG: VWA domain-containing protein, partial [Planctomycetaceae bacterium]
RVRQNAGRPSPRSGERGYGETLSNRDARGCDTVGNWLQRWWESYLGLPAVEAGQVSRWHWTIQMPWPSRWPSSVGGLLLIALVLVVAEMYRRDARSLGVGRRAVLIGLRCGALSVVLLLLAQVSVSVERTGLPLVVVLIDDSASMGLRDAYSAEADQKFVASLLRSDTGSGSADAVRFDVVRRIVSREEGRWLRELRRRHRLRIERFSAGAVSLGDDLVDDESVRRLIAELERLQPTGETTRLAEAVRQVLNQTRGTPPAAIVLLTDGIASGGDAERLTVVAPLARERLVPLFVIGIGSDQPTRDVQLAELIVDDVAFVNDPLVFTAKVKSFGLAGKTAVIELRERGQEKSLARRSITLPADGQITTVEVLFTPTKPGDHEFELVITPPPGDVDRDNNRLSQPVRVREGKLKVLLADGLPRWEFRELKNTLEREATIELHTLLQEADLEFALQDETAKPLKGRFPLTREALAEYDVVLLGDVNPGAFSPGTLELLREFVREGGGLLLIAGPQHMPVAFRGTPLETLLPIDLETARVPPLDADLREPFQPRWTEAGRLSTPLFRHLQLEGLAIDGGTSDGNNSRDVWRSLPGLFWLCEAPRLKAGATVLLEHPQRRGEKSDSGRLPVISMQRFGAGKILFHATDELWRWRFRNNEKIYSRYWIQALRFLSRTQSLIGARGVEFTADRQTYPRGEPVKLRLQVLDERQLPASGAATVMLERLDEPRRSIELARVAKSKNVFAGELRGLREGRYHAWLAEPSFPGSPPAVDFVIEAPQRELVRRRLDRADLEAATRISLGRYFALADADRVPEEIPAGQPVPLSAATIIPLWTRWELLLFFAVLLTTEWLCRRRWRLV